MQSEGLIAHGKNPKRMFEYLDLQISYGSLPLCKEMSNSSDKHPSNSLNCINVEFRAAKRLKMSWLKQNFYYTGNGTGQNSEARGDVMEKSATNRWEELAVAANYKPASIASLTQVSLRTLQRHFRREYNITISEWLRAIRLREAYSRLHSGQSVKEVAYGLGYKQLSHFSREFKKMYGVAPSCLSGTEDLKPGQVIHKFPSEQSAALFLNVN